jgi:hypothetical protein
MNDSVPRMTANSPKNYVGSNDVDCASRPLRSRTRSTSPDKTTHRYGASPSRVTQSPAATKISAEREAINALNSGVMSAKSGTSRSSLASINGSYERKVPCTSRSIRISSPTTTPPVSSAAFQVNPKSLRLIVVDAL